MIETGIAKMLSGKEENIAYNEMLGYVTEEELRILQEPGMARGQEKNELVGIKCIMCGGGADMYVKIGGVGVAFCRYDYTEIEEVQVKKKATVVMQ